MPLKTRARETFGERTLIRRQITVAFCTRVGTVGWGVRRLVFFHDAWRVVQKE